MHTVKSACRLIRRDTPSLFYVSLLAVTVLLTAVSLPVSTLSPISSFFIFLSATSSVFYGMYFVGKYCVSPKCGITISKPEILIFLLFSLALTGFFIYYMLTEKRAYEWDYGGFWMITDGALGSMKHSMLGALPSFVHQIWFEDYNSFSSLFLGLIYGFTDHSRPAYLLSVLFLLAIPVLFYFFLILKTFFQQYYGRTKAVSFLVPLLLAAVFFNPLFGQSSLLGYMDVGGLFYVLPILWILSVYDFSYPSFKWTAVVVLNLFPLLIYRRYYSYWIVAFFISILLIALLKYLLDKNRKKLTLSVKAFLNTGIAFTILCEIFLMPTILKRVVYNYVLAYSAFRHGGFLYQLATVIRAFGILPFVFAAVGMVTMLFYEKQRFFGLFLTLHFFVTCALFTMVQTMEPHHMYTVFPDCFLLMAFGFANIVRLLESRRNLWAGSAAALILLLGLNASNSFIHIDRGTGLLSDVSVRPLVRRDMPFVNRLAQYMLKTHRKKGGQFYILAASPAYNETTFYTMYLPDTKMSHVVTGISDIDLRDGFPLQFLTVKYVIVTDPVQYQFDPKYQRCVGILSDLITNNPEIRSHYREIRRFRSLGVSFTVLERETSFRKSDIEIFIKAFNRYYADEKPLFETRLKKYEKKLTR